MPFTCSATRAFRSSPQSSLYVNMSISSSLTHCLDTTLTRLPLTVTRVRKVASTDPCLVFAEGEGFEPPMRFAACLVSSEVLSTSSANLPKFYRGNYLLG